MTAYVCDKKFFFTWTKKYGVRVNVPQAARGTENNNVDEHITIQGMEDRAMECKADIEQMIVDLESMCREELHIDPAIQGPQPTHSQVHHMPGSFQGQMAGATQSPMGNGMAAVQQQHPVDLMQRYQQLQEEMNQIRSALLQNGMPMQ